MIDFPEAGKIQDQFFKSHVFPYMGQAREEVTTGPGYGVDVGVIDIGNGLSMAVTSDPLSLIPTMGLKESAWLSVQLMANDMATTGFKPMYAQFILSLPYSLNAADFAEYWKYIHNYCKDLGIAITGGHTGRFQGLDSSVCGGGTMITVAPTDLILTSKGVQPGDLVIMTQECALLSTAILSLSFPDTVRKNCGQDILQEGTNLFFRTSAVEAGIIAGEINKHSKGITAMHDVTEGGVIGALQELALASGCSIIIDQEKIPVGRAQEKVSELFEINPRHCVGAGSMLITANKDIAPLLINRLESNKIKSTIIGRVADHNSHELIISETKQAINQSIIDPYWDAFYSAYNKGWK